MILQGMEKGCEDTLKVAAKLNDRIKVQSVIEERDRKDFENIESTLRKLSHAISVAKQEVKNMQLKNEGI